jgi:hypothetical protein
MTGGFDSSHCSTFLEYQMGQNKQAVIKGLYEPLTREEQDDLFRQMQKVLDESNGVLGDRHFMAHEHVNMHRMRATIYQMRKTIEGGDTAIKQLEQEADVYRRERDAAHHVIIEAGIVPVEDTHCDCDECKSVLEGMQKAGYAR